MKRILVTGGSRGLGLAISRSLLEAGYAVVTVSRHGTSDLAELEQNFPGRIELHQGDLSCIQELPALCDKLRVRDGLDGFVANAAVGTEGLLTLTSRASIDHCLNLNLLSVILLTREVLKGMLTRGGSLVFVSSVAAVRGYSGLSVYSATKGALVSFSRSLAREYGSRDIRSNCVLPGFVETEMTGSLSSTDRERIVHRTPLKRLGQGSDVAGIVRFLLSDEARFITGAEFTVDGGLTA